MAEQEPQTPSGADPSRERPHASEAPEEGERESTDLGYRDSEEQRAYEQSAGAGRSEESDGDPEETR